MDALKKPELILGITANVGLIASIVYYYRQLKAVREDVEELNLKLRSTLQKVPDLSRFPENLANLANTINQLYSRLDNQEDNLTEIVEHIETSFVDIENINARLDAIVTTIKGMGGTVKEPELVHYSNKFTLDIHDGGSHNKRPNKNKFKNDRSDRNLRGGRRNAREEEDFKDTREYRGNARSARFARPKRTQFDRDYSERSDRGEYSERTRKERDRMEDEDDDDDDIASEIEQVRGERNRK